jgi:hypothetical protein
LTRKVQELLAPHAAPAPEAAEESTAAGLD